MHQIVCQLGFAPDPTGGRSPDPLAGVGGGAPREREGGREGEKEGGESRNALIQSWQAYSNLKKISRLRPAFVRCAQFRPLHQQFLYPSLPPGPLAGLGAYF